MAGLDTSGPLEYNPIDKEEVQGEEEEDVHTWEVKKITKAKFKDEQLSFLVIWDIDRSLTWEPLESFSGGLQHERIRNFAKKNPQKWAYLMKKIPDNLKIQFANYNNPEARFPDDPVDIGTNRRIEEQIIGAPDALDALEDDPMEDEAMEEEEEPTWKVKKITKAKFKDEQLSFLVIWDIDRSLTWEPLESFSGGLQHERIRNFAKKNPQKWAYLMKKIPDNLREALLSAKNDAIATITDGPDIDFIEEKRTGFENEQVVVKEEQEEHIQGSDAPEPIVEEPDMDWDHFP
ncbi:hypothetical protein L3Y34_000350 [Caenorhabditis briggsae]|uniref:Chromo domain-containing protein n=1 Tax=Caenorhabditis briggsae TaxID=6238 RepID=A0AAE9IM20_CAEBR|nr:hypothetical protein L3Y34_000350 [Caenorhabditis briggsae]